MSFMNARILSFWDAIEVPYTQPVTNAVLHPVKGSHESMWLCGKLYDKTVQMVPKIEFICNKDRLYSGTCGFVCCDLETEYHVRVECDDDYCVEATVPYEFVHPIIEHVSGGRITVNVKDVTGKDAGTLVGVKDIVAEDDVTVVFNWDDMRVTTPALLSKLVYTTYQHRHEGQMLADADAETDLSEDGMDA